RAAGGLARFCLALRYGSGADGVRSGGRRRFAASSRISNRLPNWSTDGGPLVRMNAPIDPCWESLPLVYPFAKWGGWIEVQKAAVWTNFSSAAVSSRRAR